MRKLVYGLLTSSLILCFAGVGFAAPQNMQYITPSTSVARGGVINNATFQTGCVPNQSLQVVGTTQIKGITVGSTGTAQCVAIADVSSCIVGSTLSSSVFESCSPANTSTYFDFSNSPIKISNGIDVITSRTDGFAAVYTQ